MCTLRKNSRLPHNNTLRACTARVIPFSQWLTTVRVFFTLLILAPRWRSLMWSAQAQAEGLTLLEAENTTGYFGVCLPKPGQPKPYEAQVTRGGKKVSLGCFTTAEEAALCVARSPEGQAAAKTAAAAPPPLTSEEARQQAQAEGLTLIVAENKAGYFGVYLSSCKSKPYEAQVRRGGKMVHLSRFATAEEAALCVARSPEGRQVAAEKAAAPPPLTSEEARQQAQVEGLTLVVAENNSGYYSVRHQPSKPMPYRAQVWRGGKNLHLGCFATAEEAALRVARLPEAQVVAEKAAAAPPLTGDDAGGDDAGEKGEEEIQVLDAVEVLVASDDDEEEEALATEAEEVTLVVERKRARESTRLGEEEPRAGSTRLAGV